MRPQGYVLFMLLFLSAGTAWSQPAGIAAAGLPSEIVDLCRTLKDRIVNQGDDVGIPTDLLGQPRPSGGGFDIGAIECDGAGTPAGPPVPPVPVAGLPAPTNFRMVTRPPGAGGSPGR
jgi:hypothetical protein